MAARASAVSGMRVVYDKEGIDPGQCPKHCTPHFHHRRRPRGRRPIGRVHNCTGKLGRCAPKKPWPPSEAVVVAVTNGRLDGFALLTRTFGTWERILQGPAEWLARES
jgi:hypothetical protein